MITTSAMTDPIQGRAPVASSPELIGATGVSASALLGEKLSLNYHFFDEDIDSEASSEFTWQARSGVDMDFTSIPYATNKEWTPEVAFVGEDVRACVTPRTADTSLPSFGERVCSSPIPVLSTRPTVSNVSIALKSAAPGHEGITVGATLSGSYMWSATNIGNNISRYAWGYKGRTKNSLKTAESGTGVNADGSIGDYTILPADVGQFIELSVLPVSDIGPTQGSVVTSDSSSLVINPTAMPIASAISEPSTEIVSHDINMYGLWIPELTYQFSSNGGYSGDQSVYTIEVLKNDGTRVTLIGPTKVTSTGIIPRLYVGPSNNAGTLIASVTPMNGKGISGARIEKKIGTFSNPASKPIVKSVTINKSKDSWEVGDTLTATADVDFKDNPPGLERSVYLWRVKRDDTVAEKMSALQYNGALTSDTGTIGSRTIVEGDVGTIIQLLYRPRVLMHAGAILEGDGIAYDDIGSPVTGTPLAESDVVPSLKNINFSNYKVGVYTDGTYELNNAGGYAIDVSEYEAKLKNSKGVTQIAYGKSRVVTPGKISTWISGHAWDTDVYLEITFTPKTQSRDQSKTRTGPTVVYNIDSWRDKRYGVDGAGFLYFWGGAVAHPALTTGNIKISLVAPATVMQPGAELTATYTATEYPVKNVTVDTSKYAWQKGTAREQTGVVKDKGVVPSYKIQEEDIGNVITLELQHCLSGTVVPSSGQQLLSCSSITKTASAAIVQAAPASEFELTHNNVGYLYMADGDGPTTEHGRLSSWGGANSACQRNGLGWRLPTVDELTVISGSDFKRPDSWPSNSYWSSEAVVGVNSQHKTVDMQNGSVEVKSDNSFISAVCVKAAGSS